MTPMKGYLWIIYITFFNEFYNKCKFYNVHFNFKIYDSASRTDSFVIYSDNEYLKYFNRNIYLPQINLIFNNNSKPMHNKILNLVWL